MISHIFKAFLEVTANHYNLPHKYCCVNKDRQVCYKIPCIFYTTVLHHSMHVLYCTRPIGGVLLLLGDMASRAFILS